jgi:hypothetical protein
LQRWQKAGGRMQRRRRLRILMPQNLRDAADAHMPATNAMSYAFITRRANRCDAPEALLRSISKETAAIKRGKLSVYFLGAIAAVQALGALPWLLKRPLCFSTAVLSNFGDCTRHFVARFPVASGGLVVGNLVFRGLTGGPPVRPLTRASFGVFSSGNALTLSLRCDPLDYSLSDAQRLLSEFVAQLEATAACFATQGAANAVRP